MDGSVLGAGDDQPFAVDRGREVVAWIGNLVDPADAEPVVIEQGSSLELEELVGGVADRWQRAGLVDVEYGVVERSQELRW